MFTRILLAFIVGGAFCVIGQLLISFTKLTPARILTGYVVSGVFLTAIGVYKPIVEFAGGGATTPLTGFGYLLATGVKKAVEEKGLIGALTGGLTATAGGITAAILFGLIMSLIFRSGDKS
ncbi:MAG: stage V sporulation protein AE [Acutalibacteraceae bacterium]|nr:stage V sporulation protein AE [Acutalibacteraceae bacterium]